MRLILSLLTSLFCLGIAQAQKHLPAGVQRPWASYPGAIGPGPAGHKNPDWGPGNGWQYYGLPYGPYTYSPVPFIRGGYFGYPAAAGSFWTNGRSLYGPPIPVYGPTPGVFGGSDDNNKFFRNPPPSNGIALGLGYLGQRSPSPRHVPQTVSVYPPLVPLPSVRVIEQKPAVSDNCLSLEVIVPEAAAEVWLQNEHMVSEGIQRQFKSPALEPGKTYSYEVVARWTENGEPKAESRQVNGIAGQTIAVDFTLPK